MINQQLATTAVNNLGLGALGIASGQLASRWADQAVSMAGTLQLTTAGTWRAPASGAVHWRRFGAPELSDATGAALTSANMAVLRLHPQTYLRLRRMYAHHFEERSDDQSIRPVPHSFAFHAPQTPSNLAGVTASGPSLPPEAARVYRPMEETGEWRLTGVMTIHDELGLIIDPVAVAAAFAELTDAFAELEVSEAGTGATLADIAGLASGRRVHFVNAHGGSYVPPGGADAGVAVGGAAVASDPIVDWPDSQTIARQASASGTLRLGFRDRGELQSDPLEIPTMRAGVSLGRDFIRVTVVDFALHLLGNRSDGTIDGVPAPDADTRDEPDPEVRDGEDLDLLVEGQAVLGAMHAARTTPAQTLAAAPVVATDFDLPADADARWPAVPALPGSVTAGSWDPENADEIRSEWTARFIATSNDVDLRLPADIVPEQAHVRVFPRLFVEGEALAERPSVERGAGTAVVATSGEVQLTLRDPLGLGGDSPPQDPVLRFDALVVPRPADATPRARLFGGLVVNIAGTDGTETTAPATTRALDDLPAGRRAQCPAPILGLPATQPATGLDAVLQALGEAEPREPPRFPTMARHDALLAAHDGAASTSWTAVLSNGWIDRRSVRALPRLGNPGNAAGPEERVVGASSAGGRLAYDLARATLSLTHHLFERLPELDDDAHDLPDAGSGDFAAAVLQTIAPVCENPELSLLSDPATLPEDWAGLATAIDSQLGLTSPLSFSSLPTPSAGDRWVAETRREAIAASYGRRDAQWALRWHIAHARSLIYIETALFGATAGGSPGAHQWDLVDALVTRLSQAPDLRVVLSLPRRIELGSGYEGWAKHFYDRRKAAITALQGVDDQRVVVYHPVGFPGRPEVQRGSAVIVDDVWALIGTSTLSRRGLTFDGGRDLSLVDRNLLGGSSTQIRQLRRRLMGRTFDARPAGAGETPNPTWIRLAQMRAAFDLAREVLADGGHGLIEAQYDGPDGLVAQSPAIADPEGRDFDGDLTTGGALAVALSALTVERV